MKIKTVISAIAAVLLLAACGNKGPLVMPQQPVPVEQEVPAPPAEAAPAPAATPATGTPAVDPALPPPPDPVGEADDTGDDGDG